MSGRRGAFIAGLTVFLVMAATGVAHAQFSASSSVSATANATTASLGLSVGATLTASYSNSSSGPVIGVLTVANTGGAPLAITLTASNTNSTLAGAIRATLWVQSGGSCGSTVPTAGVTTGTLASLPALPTGATNVVAGATALVCMATSLTGSASSYSGQATTATLTLQGTIGSNWKPSSTASLTQSVSNSAPSFVCVNGTDAVTINWPNTATANTGTVYRSQVNGSYPAGLADRSYYYREFSNQTLPGTGLPSVAGTYPWNIIEITNGVTTTAYAGSVRVQYLAAESAWIIRCVP